MDQICIGETRRGNRSQTEAAGGAGGVARDRDGALPGPPNREHRQTAGLGSARRERRAADGGEGGHLHSGGPRGSRSVAYAFSGHGGTLGFGIGGSISMARPDRVGRRWGGFAGARQSG